MARGRSRSSPLPAEVVAALRSAGGQSSMGGLQRYFSVDRNTLRRRLVELEEAGLVENPTRGSYQLVPGQLALPTVATELVGILDRAGLDAHLTGLDPLLPYVHQFVRQYPHLVYCEPAALDTAEHEISANDFVVSILRHTPLPAVPDLSRLVLLRAQPNADQYGVRSCVAPREKAWGDLLRETRRGNVPMQFMELGRILRNLMDSGADERKLRRYARQLGYRDWVDRALGYTAAARRARAEIEALREGFAS